jgi:hypothetical protein
MSASQKPGEGAMGDGVIDATPNTTQEELQTAVSQKEISTWRRIYNVLTWTPPNCRWDPAKPPQFSMSMSNDPRLSYSPTTKDIRQ